MGPWGMVAGGVEVMVNYLEHLRDVDVERLPIAVLSLYTGCR